MAISGAQGAPVVKSGAEAYTGSFGISPLVVVCYRGEDAVGLMRFTLLDRIVELEPGVRITAIKGLTLSEDYLADHFPRFPVMPGVFMLEAMTQASAWLIRASEDFQHSMVVLREARNVKYANFVAPGQTLTVTAEILSQDERRTKLKVQGEVDGRVNVSARLVLERFNVVEQVPSAASADHHVVRKMRELFGVLYRPPKPGTLPKNGEARSEAASQVISAT